MNRKEMAQLFLALIEGQEKGAIIDVVWMGAGETVWEFLTDKLGIDEELAFHVENQDLLKAELHAIAEGRA